MPSAAPDYKPPPKRKTAAQWNEEWDGKDAGMPQPFGDHFKGESGGLTHAEKYKLQRSAEGGKGGGAQGHGGPKEIDGRVLRIAGPPDRGAGETWNDLMWALAFFVVFGYTVFVAIYANTRPEEVEVVDVCTADPCVTGDGACGDGQSCVDGRCACDSAGRSDKCSCNGECMILSGVGLTMAERADGPGDEFACGCDPGWTGQLCQIQVALPENYTSLYEEQHEEEAEEEALSDVHIASIVTIALVAALVGAGWSCVWLFLLRLQPFLDNVVSLTIIAAGLCQLTFGIWVTTSNGFGLIIILGAGFTLLLLALMRVWIPFATTMLHTAVEVLQELPAMTLVTGGAIVVQGLWVVLWSLAFAGAAAVTGGPALFGGPVAILLLILSNFWTVQVIKNVVHVSCAGTAASWYFQTNERHPTRAALRRACTTSFGSVCMGSAAVAVLRTVRMLTPRHSPPQQSFAAQLICAAAMFLSAQLERLLVLFNHLAFTQIAIYGFEYGHAAKESYRLLLQVGLLPLANLALMQGIGWFGCILGGGIAALVGAALVPAFGLGAVFPAWAAATMSFAIGFGMAMPLSEALDSVTTAIFVCFAKNSRVLKNSRPQLHDDIMGALAYAGMEMEAAMEAAAEEDSDSQSDYTEEYTDDDGEDDDRQPTAGQEHREPGYGEEEY